MVLIVPCAVLVVSTGLFLVYFQAICRYIVEREFDRPYFQAIANANRLEFLSLLHQTGESRQATDYGQLRLALECDFKELDYLLKKAVDVPTRGRIEERLLGVYFRTLYLWWACRHCLRLKDTAVISTLGEVLRYLANQLGQQAEGMRARGWEPARHVS